MARADPLACDLIKWHWDNLLSEGEINILLMSPCEVSFLTDLQRACGPNQKARPRVGMPLSPVR